MKVTVHGMLCDFDPAGKKDKQGNPVPTVDLYSGGEVVKIKGVNAKKDQIGSFFDILCDFELIEFNNKIYKVFTSCKEQ